MYIFLLNNLAFMHLMVVHSCIWTKR